MVLETLLTRGEFVIIISGEFHYRDFRNCVRKNRVTTYGHWTMDEIVPNQLREKQ